MTTHQLVWRYGCFALIATLLNLLSQRIVLAMAMPLGVSDDLALAPAIVAGTGVGLVAKYLLDKRWIFFDLGSGKRHHAKRFSLYAFTGIFTTTLFWGAEAAAWFTWRTELAREAGAIAGLAVGYVVKYRLDRRFVFGEGA